MTGKNDTNVLGQTRHGFSPGRIAGGKVEQIVRNTLNIRFARPISQAQKRFSVTFHRSSPVPGRHCVRHTPKETGFMLELREAYAKNVSAVKPKKTRFPYFAGSDRP